MGKTSARDWLKEFRSRYRAEVSGDCVAEPLAMAYDKIRSEQDYVGTDVFDPYRNHEWTAVMSIMLARHARARGLYQEWEYPADGASTQVKVDYAWLERWDRIGPPVVVIEHENDSSLSEKRARLEDQEVPDLLASTASLRVLITYPWKPNPHRTSVQGICGRVAAAILSGAALGEAEFLLVLGGAQDGGMLTLRDESDWTGYLWDEFRSEFQQIPP